MMKDVIEDILLTSIHSYNHKDGVQKAVSSFNSYKASNVTLDSQGKKDDDKKRLGDGKDRSNKYILKSS